MNLLNGFGKQTLPSVIKDSFGKNNITEIRVVFVKNWNNKWEARGVVEFSNGNTKGDKSSKEKHSMM